MAEDSILNSATHGQVDLGDALNRYMQRHDLHEQYAEIKTNVLQDKEIRHFLATNWSQLSKEIVDRDFSILYEYWNQKKQASTNKPVVHKGYIPVLVVKDQRIVVLYQPDQQTMLQQEQVKRDSLIQTIGISKAARHATMTGYVDGDDSGRQLAYVNTLDFINRYISDTDDYYRGLYLHGSYGIGKTYLMAAMANQLATSGKRATLLHFPTFANELRNAIGRKDNNLQEKLQAIKTEPVLVLDDLGAESLSAWIRDDILGVILEYRMQNDLPTFFTSNFSMADLEEHLAETKDGIEPVKAERLMQRIQYLAKEVTMAGRNRRLSDSNHDN